MKIFFNYLKDFHKEDFNLRYYLLSLIFAAIVIGLNYTIDLEDGIIDQIKPYPIRSAAFFLLFGSIYLAVITLNCLSYSDFRVFEYRRFWLYLVVGIGLLAMDVAFQPSEYLRDLPFQIQFLSGKLISNLISLITTLLPLFLFYKIFDRDQASFYGLTSTGFQVKPYLQLFSVVIPIVIIGSFLPGFEQQYPMYISSQAHSYLQLPEWMMVISYELAYGWNFISIELLFRGFFVIGMIKLLGRHAIVPMAIVYSSIHFGKPLGECISSIFGGYILGVIAFYSRNIWGGVVIHMGLAWLMEVVATLQKTIFPN